MKTQRYQKRSIMYKINTSRHLNDFPLNKIMETEMLRLHAAGLLRPDILEEGNLNEVDHSLSIVVAWVDGCWASQASQPANNSYWFVWGQSS